MRDLVRELLDIISLEPLEENLFRGKTRNTGQPNLFGGLVAGQSLMAASCTVPHDRLAHSLHAYFLRPGSFNHPVIYEVERIRDGRSFTTRRVKAIQQGRAIFSLSASFQAQEEGVSHQADMPDVPMPEELEDDAIKRRERAEALPGALREKFLMPRPVEFRSVLPEPFAKGHFPPKQLRWFRLADKVEVDAATHRALLAFCSDFSLLSTSMLPHDISFLQPNVQAASLDHAMWFHRNFKIDEWLLYTTESASAQSSRGINAGRIYRRDGTLVASVMQEGLMRVHESS